jgi:hypothetical protein
VIETTPAGYHLGTTIGIRLYHLVVAAALLCVATLSASGALFFGTRLWNAVATAARETGMYDTVTPEQTWGLICGTLSTGLVAAFVLSLMWQRLATAVRIVPATYEPGPTGAAPVSNGHQGRDQSR